MKPGLLALVAFVVLAAGCNGVIDAGPTETVSDSFEFTDTIDTLRIDNPAGDVDIEGISGDTATVDRTIRYTGDDQPDTTAEVNGGTLTLDIDCGLRRRCEVDYVIKLPSSIDLDANLASAGMDVQTIIGEVQIGTASGSVRLTDVTGDVDVNGASGSIRLSDVDGDLNLNCASGSIDGTGLSADDVEVDVASGSVELAFEDGVDRMVINSASGSVTVEVPGGPYRVDTDSSSGDVDVNIATDPGADRSISVDTASGDITINSA
jgi:DUF4097 and DUF4098 domain-containing protein YvlB